MTELSAASSEVDLRRLQEEWLRMVGQSLYFRAVQRSWWW